MSSRSAAFVLDSFALLAYLADETGRPRVEQILTGAARGDCRVSLSLINLGEVLYIVERARGLAQARAALAAIEQLPIEIVPASRQAVLAAAHIKTQHALSYANAFAVAAAVERQATVVTGDPEFGTVEGTVRVEWLS